jgi:thiol:disulfide interchange protein DsbA
MILAMSDSCHKGVVMRLSASIFAIAFLTLSSSPQANIIAGHDYQVLATPQREDATGKIEVVEFFSWGCPHCYEFYPKLAIWLSTLPKEVSFKRVPVGLGHPEWEALARAFYALQATGDVNRLDAQIFEDIHKNHVWLYDEQSITAWVGRHGVDVAKFTTAFRSFGVIAATGEAEQKSEDYRLPGVPTLAIAGKYTVTGEHSAMLNTTDQLLAMERAARKQPAR